MISKNKINKYNRDYYKVNRKRILKQKKIAGQKYLAKRRLWIQKTKDKPCKDCKRKYPSYVMDFDHCRGRKCFTIGSAAPMRISLKRLRNEIKKCDLVCANCHRIRTFS